MKRKKWKIFVVPHSHWDKEWYFTKQDSDILLSMNLKNIINVFKENEEYKKYIYDGQSSVIDDCTDIFPEMKNELESVLKNNKLVIGPWYTQPDFFNITSESLVRNLLIGINTAKKFSSDWMKIAYVPDSFGHNNQMPQIYKSFNMEGFIFWRGISNDQLNNFGTLNDWRGIDGTKIRSYNFLLGYWAMASMFPYYNLKENNIKECAQKFINDFTPLLEELKKYTKNSDNKLLIPLGGDQAPIIKLTPQFIKKLNDFSEDEWVLSDYEEYFKEIKNCDVDEIEGELKTPSRSRVHKTIGSQRYDIKKLMKETEYLLYNNLEPLAIMWMAHGGDYPHETIKKSLKWLLTSQAHDSIGCCNSDETNSDIVNRISKAKNIIESEINKIVKQLCFNLCEKENSFIIFNPKLEDDYTSKKIKLFTRFKKFSIKSEGKLLDYSIENQVAHNGGMQVKASENGESVTKLEGFYETNIILHIEKIKSFSISKFEILESNDEIKNKKIKTCENKYYSIEYNKNGSVNITNKENKVEYKNQLNIYSNHDVGDSYDYSPNKEPIDIISKLVESSQECFDINHGKKMIIKNKYSLPEKVNSNNFVYQDYVIEITILDNSKNIFVNIKTINSSTEKRWRISIESDIKNNISFANQAFCEVSRPTNLEENINKWKKESWPEKPVAIETNESYVYLNSSYGKFGFITKGINEYEIINDKEIHITLYRTTPVLGRNDLLWRPGRASGTSEFSIKTNDSNYTQRELEFNFVMFDLKKECSIWKEAELYNTDAIYYQKQSLNNLYKRFDRFLFDKKNLVNDKVLSNSLLKANISNIVIKSIKKSEEGDSIIIRCFNPTESNEKISFSHNGKLIPFYEMNMLEEILIKKEITEDCLSRMKIKTFCIKLKDIYE